MSDESSNVSSKVYLGRTGREWIAHFIATKGPVGGFRFYRAHKRLRSTLIKKALFNVDLGSVSDPRDEGLNKAFICPVNGLAYHNDCDNLCEDCGFFENSAVMCECPPPD